MKPILIVKTPASGGMDQVAKVTVLFEDMPIKHDYYILVVKGATDDFVFEVFYEKDFNVVKYEELKKIVKG